MRLLIGCVSVVSGWCSLGLCDTACLCTVFRIPRDTWLTSYGIRETCTTYRLWCFAQLSQVRSYSPGNMEQAPSRGHGVLCALPYWYQSDLAGGANRGSLPSSQVKSGQVRSSQVRSYFAVYMGHMEPAIGRGKARRSRGAQWLAQCAVCGRGVTATDGLSDRGHLHF